MKTTKERFAEVLKRAMEKPLEECDAYPPVVSHGVTFRDRGRIAARRRGEGILDTRWKD